MADNNCQKPLTQLLTSHPQKGSSFGKDGTCLHPGRNFASATSSPVFICPQCTAAPSKCLREGGVAACLIDQMGSF